MAQPLFYLLLNEGYKKRAFVYPSQKNSLREVAVPLFGNKKT